MPIGTAVRARPGGDLIPSKSSRLTGKLAAYDVSTVREVDAALGLLSLRLRERETRLRPALIVHVRGDVDRLLDKRIELMKAGR